MKFSICIPNYNYESYLEQTIASVLANYDSEFEVVVADNASTDRSVEVVKEMQQRNHNIKLKRNPCNVGFAGNLDRSGAMAEGDYMIMLSSDDVMKPNALSTYAHAINLCPGAVICSSWDVIDSEGRKTGFTGPHRKLWTCTDRDPELGREFNCDVYRIKGSTLLKRCLLNMATPFNFCTAAYPRDRYETVGGYGGGRIINPDKWFHWKLLAVADEAIFIDKPLFQYRWHNQNQTSQQAASGYLKYHLDEYRNVIEVSREMLEKAGLSKSTFENAFIRNDIYRHGIGEFLKGRWAKSARVFMFGLATFPAKMLSSPYFLPFVILLATTPIGSMISRLLFNGFPRNGRL